MLVWIPTLSAFKEVNLVRIFVQSFSNAGLSDTSVSLSQRAFSSLIASSTELLELSIGISW